MLSLPFTSKFLTKYANSLLLFFEYILSPVLHRVRRNGDSTFVPLLYFIFFFSFFFLNNLNLKMSGCHWGSNPRPLGLTHNCSNNWATTTNGQPNCFKQNSNIRYIYHWYVCQHIIIFKTNLITLFPKGKGEIQRPIGRILKRRITKDKSLEIK